MRRRDFIGLLGGTAAFPIAARAQQQMPVIGFLGPSSAKLFAERLEAFRQGLGEAGFHQDRNVRIEDRWAGGDVSRLPTLAVDLARHPVTIMVAAGLSATLAAKATKTTIPIVFFLGEDPVELGLVDSLNRPGGSLTGVTYQVGPKRIELLKQLVPSANVMAVLINPNGPNSESLAKNMQEAARSLGLRLVILHASTERDFESSIHKFDRTPSRRAGDYNRRIFYLSGRTTCSFDGASRSACSLSVSRLCRSRWPNELWRQLYGLVPPSWRSTRVAFSKAKSPPNCRCSRRLRSNYS